MLLRFEAEGLAFRGKGGDGEEAPWWEGNRRSGAEVGERQDRAEVQGG